MDFLSKNPSEALILELQDLQLKLLQADGALEKTKDSELDYLKRQALISSVGSSTRIENAVLTDSEIEWIDTQLNSKTTAFEEKKLFIVDKISKDRERSLEEVIGCREILDLISNESESFFPLTETSIRALHHRLLQYYSKAKDYAGQYKKSENKVVAHNHETGEKKTVLEPASPGTITETAMADLVKWYNQGIKECPWSVLFVTEFVFRFLAIHPFQDGNGRLGRALFVLAFMHSSNKYLAKLVKYISIDRQIERNKTQYYRALQQSSEGKFHADPKKYDLESLSWFFVKVIKAALQDLYFYKNKYQNLQALNESTQEVLKSFKDNLSLKLKVSDIEEQLELPRRTIQRSLATLVEKEFISKSGQGPATRYQIIF